MIILFTQLYLIEIKIVEQRWSFADSSVSRIRIEFGCHWTRRQIFQFLTTFYVIRHCFYDWIYIIFIIINNEMIFWGFFLYGGQPEFSIYNFFYWYWVTAFKVTVCNKKTHLADFESCVFSYISPQPLELQKKLFPSIMFPSICILVWRAFRGKKNSNPVIKSAEICKNAVLTEKN